MKPLSFQTLFDLSSRGKRLSPVQRIALYFLIAIVIGGLLLALPVSHAPGKSINFLDALFTATSAICVTGLAVVDTGTSYSLFGQTIIMLLVQAGGLGIITLGTLVAFASGRRVGFRERMNLQAQLNAFQVGGVLRLIRRILLLTVSIELIGALLLWTRFGPLEGLWRGLYFAIFHSVSGFNNAGFGLYPTNLMPFVADPVVNFTIMALIVLGGLGFIVEMNIIAHFYQRRTVPFTLHTKTVLVLTGSLIALGMMVFLLLEWSHSFAGLSVWQKMMAALFQSVTPRTAGFNTVDYAQMDESSLLFTTLLMFIGASPGSTGGGIKTVTFFVLIGSVWSISRGHGELSLFGRRITLDTVIKSAVITVLSMLIIGAMLTLLTLTDSDKDTFRLTFEAVSAFGTVGLSTGITSTMSDWGKIILILLMYLGRIGPLTFTLALIEGTPDKKVRYPVEEVIIG
ncbi:MAG: TrkH family potassium uptake protein [Trueperaceae bacterium]